MGNNWLHRAVLISYIIIGVVIGVAFELDWLAGQYWFFYGFAGLAANVTYCYFTNKTIYFPPRIVPADEKYAGQRALSAIISAIAAVACWIAWYKYYFGEFSGN